MLDIRESPQAFERFQQERLVAAVQQAGITSQPTVQLFPVFNLYAPNVEVIRTAGATSLPATV